MTYHYSKFSQRDPGRSSKNQMRRLGRLCHAPPPLWAIAQSKKRVKKLNLALL